MDNPVSSTTYIPGGVDLKPQSSIGDFKTPEVGPLELFSNDSDLSKEEQYLLKNWDKYEKQASFQPLIIPEKPYKKYLDPTLWNSNPIFKDPRVYDNEDLNFQSQAWYTQLANGLIKTIPAVAVGFYNALLPVEIANFNKDDISEMYDNPTNNALADFQENMENWFPNYYSLEERTSRNPVKGLLPFTKGFGNFWGDKLIKNLGFMGGAMASAILQDAAITAATEGTGTIPATAALAGRLGVMLEDAFKGTTVLSKLMQVPKMGAYIGETAVDIKAAADLWRAQSMGKKLLNGAKANVMLLTAATGEASTEALDGSRRINETLINEYVSKNGALPTAEEYGKIKKITDEAANIRFGLNIATIFASDAIQFGSFFTPMKAFTSGLMGETFVKSGIKFGKKEFLSDTGELVARKLTRPEKVVNAITGKGAVSGFTEPLQEGLQYSFETATEDYAVKKYNNKIRGGFSDYVESQLYGMKKMTTTKEGWESMLLGFLTSAVTHPLGSAYQSMREKKAGLEPLEVREEKARKAFNKATKLFEENGLFDMTVFSDAIARDQQTFDSEVHKHVIQQQLKNAVLNKDVFAFKSLQSELLYNMVRTSLTTNKFESLLEKLDGIKSMPNDEFAKSFGIEMTDQNIDLAREYVNQLIDKAKDIKEVINLVDDNIENPIKLPTGKASYTEEDLQSIEDWKTFEALKDTLGFTMVHINNLDNRIPKVLQDILVKNPAITQDIIEKMSNMQNLSKNYIEPLDDNIKQLKQTIESLQGLEGLTPELKALNKKQLEETKEQLRRAEQLRDKLNPSIKAFNEATGKKYFEMLPDEALLHYKDIVNNVFAYEANKNRVSGVENYKMSFIDDVVKSMIDLHRLRTAVGIAVDQQGRLQTPEGRTEFLRKYREAQKRSADSFLNRMRNINYKKLARDKETSIENGKKQLELNLAKLETLQNEVSEIKTKIKDLEAKDQLTEAETSELTSLNDKLIAAEELINDIKDQNQNIREIIIALENGKETLVEEEEVVAVEETPDEEVVVEEEEYVEPIETTTVVVPAPEVFINTDQQLTAQTNAIIKKENYIPVFLRTTTPKAETPVVLRFQEFLASFRKTPIPKPDEERAALNLFLTDSNLQFSIVSPIDDFYSSDKDDSGNPIAVSVFPNKFKDFELGTKTDTREKRGVVLAITDKDGNPVKLSLQDGKYIRDDENGQYIVQNLPTNLGEFTGEGDKTKAERERILLAEYRRQVVENEKSFIPVNVIEVHPGSPNFIKSLEKTTYELTLKDLENPYLELFLPLVNGNINGYPSRAGLLEARISDAEGNLIMPIGLTFKTFPEMMMGKKLLLDHLFNILEAYKNSEDKEITGEMMQKFFESMFSNSTLNGVKVQFKFTVPSGERAYFKVFSKNQLVFDLNDPSKFALDKLKEATKGLKLNPSKKLLGKEFRILNVTPEGLLDDTTVKDYNKFLISVGKPTSQFELTLGKDEPKRTFQYIRFNVEGQEDLADKIVKPIVATTVTAPVEPKAEVPQAVQARIALVDQFGVPQAQVDRMTSDQVTQMYAEKTTPTEVTSDIEAKKADIERRLEITLINEEIETLDYLSGKKSQIKDFYDSRNLLTNLGRKLNPIVEQTGKKLAEAISKKLGFKVENVKVANNLGGLDVIKQYQTKDGNPIGDYEQLVYNYLNAKYDAELAALEEAKPVEEEVKFESTEDLFKAFQSPANVDTNETLTKEAGDEVQGIKPPKDVTLKVNTTKPKRKLESSKLLTKIIAPEITQTDIEEVQRMFGGNVNVEKLFDIVNSDAWATWSASAITLYRGSNRSDLYHEAWHNFSQLYLTKDEKTKLYNETRDKVAELKDKSDLDVEEYIARDFSKFIETGKIAGQYPERKSIFQKILDLLKQLFSGKEDLSLNTLYTNLRKGEINHKAYSTENIMFGKLNSGINDNFSARESKIIEDGLNGEIVRILNSVDLNQNESSKIEGGRDILYDALYKDLYERHQEATNSSIKENLGRILVNFDDVKRFHENTSSLFKKEISESEINEENEIIDLEDDGDKIGDEETENTGKNASEYQESSTMTFGLMDSDGTITSLISNLQEKEVIDGKVIDVVDPEFGLNKLVDSQKIINLLRERLNGITDFDGGKVNMLGKLKDLAKTNPSLLQLIDQLTLRDDADVHQLQAKFIQVFGLTKAPIIVSGAEVITGSDKKLMVKFKDGIVASNQKRAVENAILNNFYLAKSPIITKDEKGKNVINNDEVTISTIDNMPVTDVKDIIEFYKSLGLDVSFANKMTSADKRKLFNATDAGFLKQQIVLHLTNKGEIRDIIDALKTTFLKSNGKRSSGNSQLLKLINANLEFNENYISNSFFNSDGKLENEVVMWSTLQKFFDKLNNFEKYPTLQSIIEEDYYANLQGFLDGSSLDLSNSIILQRYFNRDGSRKQNANKIEILNYNGLQNREEGKLKGKKNRKLFIGDKSLMDLHYALNENIYPTMQLADKSSFFAMDISEPFIESGATFGNTRFLEIMHGYLQDELDIIKKADKLTNLKKLSKNINEGNRFGVFRDILSNELAEDLIKNGFTQKNKIAVNNEIITYFKNESKNTLDYMNSLSGVHQLTDYINIDKGDIDYAKDVNYQVNKYIMNYFVTSVETSKLLFGNTLMHKDPFKRIAGASSTGRTFLNSAEFLRKYQEATDYTQRDAFLSTLPFTPSFKDSRNETSDEIRFITFKDRVSPASFYIENYTRAIDLLISKASTPQQVTELLARRDAIVEAYSKNNASDAMGACTVDFWRKSLWLAGRWNDKLDSAYYKMVNWDLNNRRSKKEGISTEERNKYLQAVKENTLTEEEMVYFSVQKYQYYGNIKNDLIQEKGFHKFQLMPLIPQLVEGKLWEKHLERMMIEDVDYALFESADKLEGETPNNFYNENDSVDTYEQVGYTPTNSSNSYNIKTGYLEGLKEQVFMDTEIHDDLLFGSQIRKLIFNDFNEGVSKRNGEEENRFTEILKSLIDDERTRTFKEASIVKDGDNYIIEDKAKFIKFLEKEVDKKVANKNVKEYLKLTPTGEFAYDLDTNLQRQTIESIINSVLNKRLVKQRMNGEAMVQVSSVGFETYNEDGSTNKLRFYNLEGQNVRKMEVKVPLTGDFKNLLNLIAEDGERIGTIKRLNEEIRNKRIDSNAITMIGYRIPTQEHNSVEVMEVQEFLDPIAGSMIVVPYELTAKAGSDFDIDKLNVFKPQITKDGQYIGKISKEQLKEAEFQYQDLLDTLTEMETDIDKLKQQKNLTLDELKTLSDSFTELDNFIRILQKPDSELNEEDKTFKDSLYIDEEDRKAIIRRYKAESKEVTTRQKYLSQDLKNDREVLSAIYAQKALIDNYKAALQNETIDIIQSVLLRPSNFVNLVTPNSTFMFDDAIADVIKAIYVEGEDYTIENGKIKLADVKLTKMFLPKINWEKFNTLYQGKDALGIAAVANTFSQLIQRANVDFTQDYKSGFDLLFKIGTLSSNKLSNGQSKATAFSQAINLYVDIANDPRAGYANMGTKVAPIINMMINMGTPIDQIIYYINQPIIRDYIKLKDVNTSIVQGKIVQREVSEKGSTFDDINLFNYLLFGPDTKYAIDGDPKRFKMYGTKMLKNLVAPSTKLIKELGDVSFHVTSPEYLKSTLGNNPKDNSHEQNKVQLLLLAQFMQIERMGNDFFEMQRTLNFDTSLAKDGSSSFNREDNYRLVKEKNAFTNLDVLKNESVISGFNISDDIIGVNKALLPLMNNEAMYSFIKNILDNKFKFTSAVAKEKFVRTFKNDFVSYIFQRYAEKSKQAKDFFKSIYGTEDINGYGREQLENLYKDFLNLKENNPKLFEKYSLLNNMFVSTPKERGIEGRPDYKNIGLVYFNNDTRVQNSYIEQFKELLTSENENIRKFMNNFAILSFYQSGLNKSRISSTDILPVNIIGTLLKMAKDQYDLEVNTDAKRLAVLNNFYKEYEQNNNWNPEQNKAKVEYYVTKDYSVKKAKVPLSQMNKGKKLITDDDLSSFDSYLEKSNDVLPNEFFTSKSRFREFAADGKSRPAPQTTKWQLNENFLYDLVDKQSGEVYIENVNLRDGHQYTIKEQFKTKVEAPIETKPIILEREYTPENITSLKPNEVFVFGSNTEGRHGAGAAKLAKDKFGAIYGQAEGLQGQSYGIVTKNLKEGKRSKNLDPKGEYNALDYIDKQIGELISYATKNPNKKFYVTKLGTMLAGWTTEEIGEIWNSQGIIPNNIILPKEFENYINPENREAKTTAAPIEIEPGRYVKYNGETFIVTKINQNKTIQIYNPLLEGVNAKKYVSKNNLEALDTKAKIVNYQSTDYIVTPKETIISLQTNKIQKWAENDGKRLAILALTKEAPKEEIKIGEAVPEGYTAIEDMFGETQKTDEEILNSPAFNDYMISELEKDPSLTEKQILENYKKCK